MVIEALKGLATRRYMVTLRSAPVRSADEAIHRSARAASKWVCCSVRKRPSGPLARAGDRRRSASAFSCRFCRWMAAAVRGACGVRHSGASQFWFGGIEKPQCPGRQGVTQLNEKKASARAKAEREGLGDRFVSASGSRIHCHLRKLDCRPFPGIAADRTPGQQRIRKLAAAAKDSRTQPCASA